MRNWEEALNNLVAQKEAAEAAKTGKRGRKHIDFFEKDVLKE